MRRKYLAGIVAGLLVFILFFTFQGGFYPKTDNNASLSSIEQDSIELMTSPALRSVISNYDRWVNQHINSGYAPGAAVAIVSDGQILHLRGYGKKNVLVNDSVDINTVFRIASVSKGFASIMAGVLVEDSLMNWNDKVSKFIPDFALKDTLNSKELAIKNLLSHTTGLPRHAYTDLIEGNSTFPDMIASIQQLSLIGPVGKYYSYQNVIYSLISNIAEKVTNRSYDRLMYEKLFDPLGMNNASVCYDSIVNCTNYAMPHIKTKKGWKPTNISQNYYNVIPAAGVNASIADMAQWLLAVMGQKPEVISIETLEKIYSPVVETPKRRYLNHWPLLQKAHYGFGWRIFDYAEEKIIYHGGYVNDFRAEIGFDLKNKIGIVVLTNSPSPLANKAISNFFVNYYKRNRRH